MTSSESDSDCFKSADDGSDDEVNIKYLSEECHPLKYESDHVELSSPTSSDMPGASVIESLPESESAGNSQQYRKRPLRRKNSVEKKYVKQQTVKKISLNEQIFKTEKIKPDILIQDITNNLSKNFNKGFTTIQQTSNSLKDLVLHALPVSNPETTEGRFSYDDEEEIVIQKSDEEDSDNGNRKNLILNELDEMENLNKDKEIEVNPVHASDLSDLSDASRKEEEQYQKIQQDIKFCKSYNEESKCRDVSKKINSFAENNKMKNTATKTIKSFIVDSTEKDVIDQILKEQCFNSEMKEDVYSKIKEMKQDDLCCSDNKNPQTKNEENNISGWDFSEFSMKSTEAGNDISNILIPKENSLNLFSNEQEPKNLGNDKSIHKNIEDNSNLDANDGWDDFDIEDEDIDNIVKNEKNSLENILTEEKHKKVIDNESNVNRELRNKFSFEKSTLQINNLNKNESDCKWSGWDSFGEKQEAKQKTAWNLGNWSVNALLNTATCVTQGISNVIEVGLGAPDPEILAKMEKQSTKNNSDLEEKDDIVLSKSKENLALSKEEDNSNSGLNLFPVLNLVAGVTNKIVEHSKVHEIGSKVISGSLDTLETFGKKTMEVLQEGDPGFKKKRALFLGLDKPILSQVLREAKMKNELEDKKHEEKEIVKMCHFETLFDDFQGLVHLEALEMLSRQCQLKLDQMKASLPSDEVDDLISIIDEVKELCVIEDNEMESGYLIDFKTSLKKVVEPLKNEISVERIIEVYEELDKWLKSEGNSVTNSQILLLKGMSTMAELTAVTVHQFHKCGELLSVKERRKTVEEADVLLQMTGLLTSEVNNLSKKFLKLYSSLVNEGNSESYITVFSKIQEEAGNATTYIKDAFNLLIPVLQLGAAI